MKRLRHISAVLPLAGVILFVACDDPPEPVVAGSTLSTPSTPSPDRGSARPEVYEVLIRHLVDPKGTQPVYVLTDLCFQLMRGEPRCPDDLTPQEQQELGEGLQDLGDIVFRSMDDPGPPYDEQFQQVLLGPIVERPNGLRVEGGNVCGGLCGRGAVYIVVATESGYEVTGTDDTYGEWIA
jgi:hypothetical protein